MKIINFYYSDYWGPEVVQSSCYRKVIGAEFTHLHIPSMGRHGILIFSCLLFVLFEKTKPDVFVLSLSLCYTMASLGNYCSKIICLQKKVEMGQKNILLSCECWQTFVLTLLLTLQMFTGVYRVIKGFFCKICRENPIIKIKFPCNL